MRRRATDAPFEPLQGDSALPRTMAFMPPSRLDLSLGSAPVLTESGTRVGSSVLPRIRVCRSGSAQATRSQPWIGMKRASLRARPHEDEHDAAHAPPPRAFHANGAPSQPFASRRAFQRPRVCPGGSRRVPPHGLPGQTLPEHRTTRSNPIRGLVCELLKSRSRISMQKMSEEAP